MASTAGSVPPPISWAQRNDLLYVIVDVECKDIEYSVTENSFTFKATNSLDGNTKYEVVLNFLHPVDPQKVTSKDIGRCIEYTIYKKESGPFWKSLTNDTTKLHFLKSNFTKWKNESDDEEEDVSKKIMFNDLPTDKFASFDDYDDYDSDDAIPSLLENDDDDNEQGIKGQEK